MGIKEVINRMSTANKTSQVKQKHFNSAEQGQQKQYFADTARNFFEQTAEFSDNLVQLEVENVYGNTGEKQYTLHMARVAPIIPKSSASIRAVDEWRDVWFVEESINHVQLGTKAMFYNKLWLAVNPDNICNLLGNSLFRACVVVYNRLDYYGNVLTEPFVKEQSGVTSVADTVNELMISANGSFKCQMQFNLETKDLADEDRMIIGGNAYIVKGLQNFIREYTFDKNSVRMLYFTLVLGQVDNNNDDIVNDLVDSLNWDWTITVDVNTLHLVKGNTGRLNAVSKRKGVKPTQPFNYLWTSSDETIVKVDESGNYEAINDGIANIFCTLKENPKIYAITSVDVTDSLIDVYTISFNATLPEFIKMYDSAVVECYLYKNSVKLNNPVTFKFSNPPVSSYKVIEMSDNSVKIACRNVSSKPLTVIATAVEQGLEYVIIGKIKMVGV